MGTDDVSLATLRALHESAAGGGPHPHLVSPQLHVVCPGDRPAGRGQHSTPVPVKEFAQAHALRRLEVPFGTRSLRDWRGWDEGAGRYDVGVVVSFGYFLRPAQLDRMRWGALNMHPSLLPRYRGAAPISHALLAGEAATGVSIIDVHRHAFDAGRILRQEATPIGPAETATQ